MRWFTAVLFTSTLSVSTVFAPTVFASSSALADRPSELGESCTRTADCRAPLRCVGNTCRQAEPTDEAPVVDELLVRRTDKTLAVVAAAAGAYQARTGEWPSSLRRLVRARLLRGHQVVDAWGVSFSLGRAPGSVCSAGSDRVFGTRDDQCAR